MSTQTLGSRILKELIEWGKSLIFALIIGALILVFARPSFIIGPSMEPTFQDKNVVFVEKISYLIGDPQRYDVIVAKTDLPLNKFMTKSVIKRIIGLPGDSIAIKDGMVFVNGNMINEAYLKDGFTNGDFQGTVPDDHYFVMGDNRLNSNDSRSDAIGYVPTSSIKGKVYLRIYPFNEIGGF